jgi:hypothetical protein
MITWVIEYPRIILAELNTHRALSKNSSSSRAIPFAKMIQQLNGRPVRFGQANPGMQDKGEDFGMPVMGSWGEAGVAPEIAWEDYRDQAVEASKKFFEAGYHKQVYNRLTEPFQMMKTVISGTCTDNFFWLRDDDAADPTLRELARVMRESKDASVPQVLKAGHWHLPYMDVTYVNDNQYFHIKERRITGDIDDNFRITDISLEDAIKVSCARCAAVSYRNEDYGLKKCLELYDRLVGADKKHASALEHCATPIATTKFVWSDDMRNIPFLPETWEKGISHMDRKGNMWSGNLKGWIQYRKTIDGENYEEDAEDFPVAPQKQDAAKAVVEFV